jgi:hypothetical protein
MSGGVAFAWWRDKQATERKLADQRAEGDRKAAEARADTERDLKEQQARQGIDANLTLASSLRKQLRFNSAALALALAWELANRSAPDLRPTVEQAQRDLAFVVQLDDIRYRKWTWISERGTGGQGHFDTEMAPSAYRKAFAERGLNLDTLDVTEAAERITASAAKAELVAAVDDWALFEPNDVRRARLLEITQKADKGVWTDRLRTPAVWKDKAAVAKLAADADPDTTSPSTLSVLAELMWRNRLNPAPLLLSARAKHPSDFELAFALGRLYSKNIDGEQIGPYEAACALRPDNRAVWNNLGLALRGRLETGVFSGRASSVLFGHERTEAVSQ